MKEKIISRTFNVTHVDVRCVNTDESKIETMHVVLLGDLKREKILKEVEFFLNKEFGEKYRPYDVVDVKIEKEIYGMTTDVFLNHAQKMKNNREFITEETYNTQDHE